MWLWGQESVVESWGALGAVGRWEVWGLWGG